MKNILALIGAAVVVLGGLGWYLGWYRLGSEPAATGHRKIEIDVDTAKIRGDVQKGKEKLQDVLSKETNKVAPAAAAPPSVPGNTVKFNSDGSVSYQGTVTFPPLIPGGQNQRQP